MVLKSSFTLQGEINEIVIIPGSSIVLKFYVLLLAECLQLDELVIISSSCKKLIMGSGFADSSLLDEMSVK
jgi:hypothetical protein